MSNGLFTRPLVFFTGLLCILLQPTLAAEWEEVMKRSGAFVDSTDGGGRAKRASQVQGPTAFEVKGRQMRVKWSTERDGRNPDFRVEIEQRIKLNNGGNRWQRFSTFGRTHDNTKSAKAFDCPPGSYRISIIGHSMKYEVLVEAPNPDSKD